jgi:hypothetical protein
MSTRFGLNVEKVRAKPWAEEAAPEVQLMAELKDRLPADAEYKLTTGWGALLSPQIRNPITEILLVLIRCEFKARYDCLGNWRISAQGALPMIFLILAALAVWGRWG